jgi:hypothetical protein
MRTNPKHRQLLPLFLGQPVGMIFFSCVMLLIGCFLFGCLTVVYHTIQETGFKYFLPTQYGWGGAVAFGFAFALFNIGCDSVEIDVEQGRKSNSFVTLALLVLCVGCMLQSIDCFLMNTAYYNLIADLGSRLVISSMLSGVGLYLFKSHRKALLHNV